MQALETHLRKAYALAFAVALFALAPMTLVAQTLECETWEYECTGCVEQEGGSFKCDECTFSGEDCTLTPA